MYGSPVKCKKKHIFLERDLLIDLRLGGKVSKEEFQTKKQKLKDCQYEISQLLKQMINLLTPLQLTNLASEAYETFKGSESPQKRKMISFILQNLKLNDQKLEFTLRFPFYIFEKTTTSLEWLPGPDSNQRPNG